MNSKSDFSWKRSLCALVIAGSPAIAISAGIESHSLEVHVLDRQSGDAIGDAAVCLGTAAKPDQFGAFRTDAGGVARFLDLPPNALLVTVSRRGSQGIQQQLDPVTQNRVIVLKLASGGGGPQCDAPTAAPVASAAPGLTIERVTVSADPAQGAEGQVLLSMEVSGKANQVRVSEHSDFEGADWQPLRSPVPFMASPGAGSKQLYVQVRHHLQAEGAVIEVVSPVERVRYRR